MISSSRDVWAPAMLPRVKASTTAAARARKTRFLSKPLMTLIPPFLCVLAMRRNMKTLVHFGIEQEL
jgi:hypothetical protein